MSDLEELLIHLQARRDLLDYVLDAEQRDGRGNGWVAINARENARTLDLDIWRQAQHCRHGQTEYGVVVTSNGVRMVMERCYACRRNVRGEGRWVAKDEVPDSLDVAALPVFADYSGSGKCDRCGAEGPVERHHWAPRHLFLDADKWPQGMLCATCHRRWHQVVTPTMHTTTGVTTKFERRKSERRMS